LLSATIDQAFGLKIPDGIALLLLSDSFGAWQGRGIYALSLPTSLAKIFKRIE